MGYSIFLLRADFFIPQESHRPALETMKNAISAKGGQAAFAFINKQACLEAETFVEAMRIWRWLPERDDDENIVSFEFVGEKLGDEDVLFGMIAPFVKDGSNIQMAGEDGRVWRWFFHSGVVEKEEGEITFHRSHSTRTQMGNT